MQQVVKFITDYLKVIILVIITLLIFGAGLWAYNKFGDTISSVQNKASSAEMAEFDKYNGRAVDGSEVVQAIALYSKSPKVGVMVVDPAIAGGTLYAENTLGAQVYYTPGSVSPGGVIPTTSTTPTATVNRVEAGMGGGTKWINPANSYMGAIWLDSAGNVVLIRFTKI